MLSYDWTIDKYPTQFRRGKTTYSSKLWPYTHLSLFSCILNCRMYITHQIMFIVIINNFLLFELSKLLDFFARKWHLFLHIGREHKYISLIIGTNIRKRLCTLIMNNWTIWKIVKKFMSKVRTHIYYLLLRINFTISIKMLACYLRDCHLFILIVGEQFSHFVMNTMTIRKGVCRLSKCICQFLQA